jgi:release factor glutamine methyltransferase
MPKKTMLMPNDLLPLKIAPSFLHWWQGLYAPLDASPAQSVEELKRWLAYFKLPTYETLAYVMTPNDAYDALSPQWEQWHALLEKRLNARVPIQYLLEEAPFLGMTLVVRPPCLIPRPETELLVEAVVQRLVALSPLLEERVRERGGFSNSDVTSTPHPSPPLKGEGAGAIWEVGIGTGCISVGIHHLLKEHPQNDGLHYYGGDLCLHALKLAQENADTQGLAITLFESDLLDGFPADLAAPDCIVANLPYIDRDLYSSMAVEVRDHEGHHTLFAEYEGFALIFRLIEGIHARFGDGWQGFVALEFGENMHERLKTKLDAHGFTHQAWISDYGGIVRHVLASRLPMTS